MSGTFARVAGVFAATLLAAGCASMHGLSTQAALQSADALAAQQSLASASVATAAWPNADWWRSFSDSQLDQLMDEAFAESPTLKIAAARTRKALAFADVSKAALYPQVNADLEITRERFSERGQVPPPLAGSWSTPHQLQATFSWELDFWGKNRAAYESALGVAKATEIDAYAARLALSTSIAQTYVQLQRAYLQLDVAQATLKEREQLYALTRDRNAAGLDSRLELKQAESAVPATREQIAQLEEAIELSRNQLAAPSPARTPITTLRWSNTTRRLPTRCATSSISSPHFAASTFGAQDLEVVADSFAVTQIVSFPRGRERMQLLCPLHADLRSRRLAVAINLIRALGGGFDEAAILVAAAH